MRNFFKIIFASCFGFMLSWFVIVFIGILIVAGVASSSDSAGEESEKNKDNTVLVLSLNNIQERSPAGFKDFSSFDFFGDKVVGLNDIIEHIETAKNDSEVKAVYLDLNRIFTSWTNIEEVRKALIDFKTSGKPVFAFGDVVSKRAYYLGTIADNIYISPTGILEFNGFSMTRMYWKGALDKLGVKMQIFKHGKYKSAVEPFMREDMSEASKEQSEAYLESIYSHYLKNIAKERKVMGSDLHRIADELLIQQPKDAIEYNLIDGIKYKDQMMAEVVDSLGVDNEDAINFVALASYVSKKEEKQMKDDKYSASKKKIAIIYAEGEINTALGNADKNITAKVHANAIRQARKDTTVKAIVLRINSPGGSALASDIIWREVVLAKAEKPVVVSMGQYAASGGYYIACPADKIVAEPVTLTGSIGVFGMLPYTGGFMKDKLGLTFDGVKTTQYADIGSTSREVNANERRIIQSGVERIYTDFIEKVAEGRGMTVAAVDSIGQGRIWSGVQAIKIGLVDTLGGVEVAMNIAQKLAKIDAYELAEYPKRKLKPWQEIMGQIGNDISASFMNLTYGEEYTMYKELRKVLKYEDRYQAIIPFRAEIN